MEYTQSKRFEYANISKRFLKADLEDFDDKTHTTAINFITDEGWRCMVVLGPIGTGKTHLAAAMAKKFCVLANCYYTTAYAMSQRIIKDMNADFFEKQSMLLIDEVSRGYETKAEQNRFFDLVNNYYNDEKPLIFFGNKNIDEVFEAVGPAVGS